MYCFAPILEVAEVFEMTPFFPTSGQKNDCTCSYFDIDRFDESAAWKTEQQNQNQKQIRVWK